MSYTERNKYSGCGATRSLSRVVALSTIMLFVGLLSSADAAVVAAGNNVSSEISSFQSMRRAQPCPDECNDYNSVLNLPWAQICEEQTFVCGTCPECGNNSGTDAPTAAPTGLVNDNNDPADGECNDACTQLKDQGMPWTDPDPNAPQVCKFPICIGCPQCDDGDNGTGGNTDTDAPTVEPTPINDDNGDDNGTEGNTESDVPSAAPTPINDDNGDDTETDAPSAAPTPINDDNGDDTETDAPSVAPTPINNDNGDDTETDAPTAAPTPINNDNGDDTETDAPTAAPTPINDDNGDDNGAGGDNDNAANGECSESCSDLTNEEIPWTNPDPDVEQICEFEACTGCPQCKEAESFEPAPEPGTDTDAPTSAPTPSLSEEDSFDSYDNTCERDCYDLEGIPWTDPDPMEEQICLFTACSGCPECNEDNQLPEPGPSPTPRPTPRPTPAPQDSYGSAPTYKYTPPDDDPVNVENDDAIKNQGERPPETPQEMLQDRNVKILAGILGGLSVILLLLTAHQVMENPDGLCAGICRLSVKCVCLILKIVCLPCRFICGCGSNKSRRGHVPANTIDDTNLRYDLELA